MDKTSAKLFTVFFLQFVFTIFCGCGSNYITISGFDKQAWKADSFACDGYRESSYKKLCLSKSQIIGHSFSELCELLGKPNDEEIGTGERRVFYFVDRGIQCVKKNVSRSQLVNNSIMAISLSEKNVITNVNVQVP
jgi:hypothetical protein